MKKFYTMLAIAGFITAFDRWTKYWVVTHFLIGESRPVTSFISLTYVHNTGTAFGLFQGRNDILLALAFIILAVLFYSARGLSERGGWLGLLGVALVIGGAIGNIIDRWRFDQVIDFIDLHFWPVFNVADSAISIGTIGIVLALWFKDRRSAGEA
jgi:signal peptidase II